MVWKWLKKFIFTADTTGGASSRQNEKRGEAAAALGSFSYQSGKPYINCCERCGACCAFFPVSFPESDLERLCDRRLLTDMSAPLAGARRIMAGTQLAQPRCAALRGEVGVRVNCTIYANRPSTCRNFRRSWEDNQGNSLCDRARGVFGLDQFSQY